MNTKQKHITIKLFAGLGNQLFQYSYGQYLKEQGYKVSYILNRSFNKDGICTDFPGVFSISDFNLKSIYMPGSFCKKLRLAIHKAIAKFLLRDYSTDFYQKADYVTDFSNDYYHFTRENDYKQTEIYQKIASCESVFIHIRGGDYHSEIQYDNICTAEYYAKAITQIKQKIQNPHFFIFSNDIEYAKEIISTVYQNDFQNEYTFVSDLPSPTFLSRDPGFDLYLMSQCNHAIIANSTYSWWGAFMQKQIVNHIIISPKIWTHDNKPSAQDIIPKEWKENAF